MCQPYLFDFVISKWDSFLLHFLSVLFLSVLDYVFSKNDVFMSIRISTPCSHHAPFIFSPLLVHGNQHFSAGEDCLSTPLSSWCVFGGVFLFFTYSEHSFLYHPLVPSPSPTMCKLWFSLIFKFRTPFFFIFPFPVS